MEKTVRYNGADLERWRLENGWEVIDTLRLFGLSRNAWDKIIKNAQLPIQDRAVATLLHLFNSYPETAPKRSGDNLRGIFHELGFENSFAGLKKFSVAVGRSYPNVNRVISHGGKLGKTPERLLEAYLRLQGDSQRRMDIIMEVAKEVQTGMEKRKE